MDYRSDNKDIFGKRGLIISEREKERLHLARVGRWEIRGDPLPVVAGNIRAILLSSNGEEETSVSLHTFSACRGDIRFHPNPLESRLS
jgi:hypothetical protein